MKRILKACFPDFARMSGKTMLMRMTAAMAAAVAAGLSPAVHAQTTSAAQQAPSARSAETHPVAALSPFIDVHTHLDQASAADAIESAVQAMPAENNAKYLFLPSPFAQKSERSFDIELIQSAAKKYSDKVAASGGGGTLNPMIQEAVRAGATSPELKQKFKERVDEIVRRGAAGIGELAAEHRPSVSTPAYYSAPVDHPLFLLLADIAAEYDLPIILHLEAVPETMPIPSSWHVDPMPNPPELRANIPGLERLLSHNSRAKIVWAHGGWDNTGFRTPELCRRLLQAHPNLYMEIKLDPLRPGLNSPLTGGASGTLKPEWMTLFQDFPDRFVIGSDQHYPMPRNEPQRWQAAVLLFNQLPEDLRRKFGTENAMRIYKLDSK